MRPRGRGGLLLPQHQQIMNTTIAASLRRLLLIAGVAPAFTAFAQTAEPEKLPDYVFTATRTPAALTTLGTYVDQISGAELARMQARHGHAVLIDCHSMPTPLPGRHGTPQIVLGDLHGRSAAPALVAAITDHFTRAGLRVVANDPYAGGYTTAAHGAPATGIHAVQIEIDRALYMDTARLRPNAGFAKITALMTGLIDRLLVDMPRLGLGAALRDAAE